MLQLAEHILNQKKGHFDPDKFEDRYEDALSALIKAKRAGKEPPAAPEPKPSNVINLMDALRRSVGERGGKSRGAPRAKSSGRRTSAKRKTGKHKRLKKAS
jgi:DNA end-binding protein Ku